MSGNPRYDQPMALYMIERSNDDSLMQSYPDYIDMRDRNRSFKDLALYQITQAGLDTGGNATPAWLYETSGNYFDSLGIQPYLGRFFHHSDGHRNFCRANIKTGDDPIFSFHFNAPF